LKTTASAAIARIATKVAGSFLSGVDGEETKYGRRDGDRREHDGGVRAGVGAPAVARDGDE
jgi:hypothetical protein